ncbi:MAG: hypothetical protein OXB99_07330 [Acidimicrobiaceae bacterium]|nr:hypothetical protein [Acidimicrobiaceae bacterium]
MFDQARRESDDSQIDDVLDEMRRQASDSTDLGTRFEQLCKGVLRALRDDEGNRAFDRVDVWDEWAGREGPAGGIDLVAQRSSASGGDAIAIRCECHSDGRRVSSRDVDSFLAKSGSATFRARMLIHTATGLSAHLQRMIDSQHKPCHVVDLAELRRWKLDWWAAAEAVGAVAPQSWSSDGEAVAGRRRGADERSSAERQFGQAGGILGGAALPVTAIAAGTFMVFAGAAIGALVIIGGIVALALRRGTRGRSATRPAGQPAGNRRRRPRPQRRPDGAQTAPPRSDGWDDDEWLDDDDYDEFDEDWDDDKWDMEDEWDDDGPESYRRSTGGRRRRAESWETGDADYI